MGSLRHVLIVVLVLAQPLIALGATPAFLGSAACSSCHGEQAALWGGSHHERAMQPAATATVLGDFRNATFKADGIEATFLQKDGKFFIRTEGPERKRADFEVKYTFGWTPLQQYLVELPRGRLQAFTIAWDARPKGKGGQRWFNLYPGERIKRSPSSQSTRPRYPRSTRGLQPRSRRPKGRGRIRSQAGRAGFEVAPAYLTV